MPKNLQLLNALNASSSANKTASKPAVLPLPPLSASKPSQQASEKSFNFKQSQENSHYMSELFASPTKTVQEQNNLASHFLIDNVKSKLSSYSPLQNEPKPSKNHLALQKSSNEEIFEDKPKKKLEIAPKAQLKQKKPEPLRPPMEQLSDKAKDPSGVQRVQKQLKLRDFESLAIMSETDLDTVGLQYLQKLYMLQPTKQSCLLYRLQQKQNSSFDGTEYTETMLSLFSDCYHLPNHPVHKRLHADKKERHTTDQPYDELFIWSLLLYAGNDDDLNLPRFYWSRTKQPIACCLAAINIYQNFKQENFVPDYLKEEMDLPIKEFEMMAIEVLKISNEKDQLIAQDLIICELEIFFKHTVLELAIKAKAYDFVCLAPVQQLLTDVWYDKINSHISSWQIIAPYVFAPALLTNAGEIFRSDINELVNQAELSEKGPDLVQLKKNSISPIKEKEEEAENNLNIPNSELSYRSTKGRLVGIYRIHSFHNAPIIKFINHFIAFVFFLLLFSYFLLFDYYPDMRVTTTVIISPVPNKKDIVIYMTITELILIISVVIYHLAEVEQFLKMKNYDQKFFAKLKNFFAEDKWNIFDVLLFLIFYAAMCVRLLPMYGNVIVFFGSENCYEVARVLYAFDLILWYIRILQKVSCLTFWGPKIIIIEAMVNKLIYYVVLILIFLIPFSTSVESILNKTQRFSFTIIINSFNRTFWSMFGELLGILDEFHEFQCDDSGVNSVNKTLIDAIPDGNSKKVCEQKVSSLFLYGSFAFYIVTCNLLLLNMIIATFASTVEEIERDSTKFYRFQRFEGIREFANKSMIPAPFVIVEYIISIARYCKAVVNGDPIESADSFRIENLESFQSDVYIQFETASRDQFYDKKYIKKDEDSDQANSALIQTVNRLDKSLDLFKIWTQEQLNERFDKLSRAVELIANRLDNNRLE